jgi:protein-S-isoprenylcysteine O-methyltransferase Ste14
MMKPTQPGAPITPGRGSVIVAWLGGAAFAVSLAVFVWAYAVPFGRATSGPIWPPAVVDVGLFSVFALHHSLLARTRGRAIVRRLVPAWMERSLYTWTASLLFIAVLFLWQPVGGTLYSLAGGWRWLGWGVQLAGVLLTAVSSSAIDVLDLAGVRPVLAARHGTPPRHVPLETGGPYGLVRHPVYLAWVLMVFGTPAMTGTRAVFAIVSTAYLAVAIPFEERSLVATFGDHYRLYQRHTRWRMLPGIW